MFYFKAKYVLDSKDIVIAFCMTFQLNSEQSLRCVLMCVCMSGYLIKSPALHSVTTLILMKNMTKVSPGMFLSWTGVPNR